MKKIIIVGLSIFISIVAAQQVFAFEDGDLQLWNTDSIAVKLDDHWKITLEEELRFGDNISELYYTHTDGGLVLSVTDGLDFGLKYRQVYEKKNGEWKEENRPHFNATVKWAWKDFKFKDRNRLELRIPESKNDKWRYRNELTVESPWKWTDFDIQPYVSDEIFVDFYGEKLNRNRLYAGIKFKLFEHFKSEVFYLWQSSKKSDDWIDYNVIGIKLKLVF